MSNYALIFSSEWYLYIITHCDCFTQASHTKIIYKSSTPMLVIPIGYNCVRYLHTTEALEKYLEAICSFKFRATLARHGFSSDNLFVEVGRYDSTTM